MVEELRKLKAGQVQEKHERGDLYEDHNLVFAQAHGKYLHTHNVIARDFNKVIERAKVPRIRFHDLRHCTDSFLVALGVDVNTVSKILGHHSASFTLSSTFMTLTRRR